MLVQPRVADLGKRLPQFLAHRPVHLRPPSNPEDYLAGDGMTNRNGRGNCAGEDLTRSRSASMEVDWIARRRAGARLRSAWHQSPASRPWTGGWAASAIS